MYSRMDDYGWDGLKLHSTHIWHIHHLLHEYFSVQGFIWYLYNMIITIGRAFLYLWLHITFWWHALSLLEERYVYLAWLDDMGRLSYERTLMFLVSITLMEDVWCISHGMLKPFECTSCLVMCYGWISLEWCCLYSLGWHDLIGTALYLFNQMDCMDAMVDFGEVS